MQVGGKTFSDIYSELSKTDLLSSSHHVRGKNPDDPEATTIYKHTALFSRIGSDGRADRQQKFENGARAIKEAIAREYTPELAERVFQSVGQAKGRDLDKDLKWKDLKAINAALTHEVAAHRAELAVLDDVAFIKKLAAEPGWPEARRLDGLASQNAQKRSVDFLKAVAEYRTIDDLQARGAKARAIYDEFIRQDLAVNLTDTQREEFDHMYSDVGRHIVPPNGRSLFDEAETSIARMLMRNIPRSEIMRTNE